MPHTLNTGLSAASLELTALEQANLVLDLGSFRKASEVLGVQPSAVSRRIRSLEEALGVGLFQRHTQGVRATKAGLEILKLSRRLLEDVSKIKQIARSSGAGGHGSLDIGIVGSASGGFIRALVHKFIQENQGVQITFVEAPPLTHAGDVRSIQLDLAFLVGEPPTPGCVSEQLWSEKIVVALSENHRLVNASAVEWLDLEAEQFIVGETYPGPEIQEYVVQHLALLGRYTRILPCRLGPEGIMAMVSLGQGLSLRSDADAAVRYPGVVYKELAGARLPFSLVWSERNDNPALRRFLSLARRLAREASEAADAF